MTDKSDTATAKAAFPAAKSPSPRELSKGLNQPWRAAVAGAEVLLAAGAAVLAVLAWRHGVRLLDIGTGIGVTKYDGGMITLAVVLGGTAVVLVIDAIRQVLLAVKAASRKPGVVDEPFVDDLDLD